jgi:hypothetical protein
MALSYSRYSKIYQRIGRPDLAQAFPRHVFLREANYPGREFTNSHTLLVRQ